MNPGRREVVRKTAPPQVTPAPRIRNLASRAELRGRSRALDPASPPRAQAEAELRAAAFARV